MNMRNFLNVLLRSGMADRDTEDMSVQSFLEDKDAVLEDFRAERLSTLAMTSAGMRQLHLSATADEAPLPPRPLAGLREIRLREMKIGQRHEGFVLRGTFVESPFKMTAVITVLEDEDGMAVSLCVYNSVSHSATQAAVEARFPRGMRVAVKEPYLKLGMDGKRITVRVDNPADIVDLGAAPGPAQGAGGATGPATVQSVEVLRKEGNRHFSAQQWDKAIELYSRCINEIEAGIAGALFDAAIVSEQRTAAYSNRAEAWLRLRNHVDALRDASRALEFDRNHVKSVCRKAKALCGLFCYKEAIVLLQSTLNNRRASLPTASRSSLETLVGEALQGETQKTAGHYELDSYYLAMQEDETAGAPACSDFVGPVEIRKVAAGGGASGRGLFAIRRIKAGELVLVSNPLAVARANDQVFGITVRGFRTLSTSVNEDLITEVTEVAKRSPRSLRQLYSLSDSTPESISEVPPMDLFKPLSDSSQVAGTDSGESEQADIARVRCIVNANSFRGPMGVGGLETVFPDVAAPSGLWVLPSFINHSCLPNCTWNFVGNAMFVRAFRDIRPGEEVTIVYTYIHQPLQERTKFFSQHSGFECCCRRCSFEKDLAQTFPVLNRLYEDFVNLPPRDNKQVLPLAASGDKIARELEEVLKQLPPDDASKKNWIRASFMRAYMCMSSRYLRQAMQTDDWKLWTETMILGLERMFSILPTEEVLTQITGALYHVPFPEKWTKKWRNLAVKVCTSMYGPLDEGTVHALIERSSSVVVPL